jgi:hypothetical protein
MNERASARGFRKGEREEGGLDHRRERIRVRFSARLVDFLKEGDTRSPKLIQGQRHPIQSASGACVRIEPPHRRIEARRVTFLFSGSTSNKAARSLPST